VNRAERCTAAGNAAVHDIHSGPPMNQRSNVMQKKRFVCSVIPPHVLRNVARRAADPALRTSAQQTLTHMRAVATCRVHALIGPTGTPSGKSRNVYDGRHTTRLPGTLAWSERSKGQSRDVEVREAFEGSGIVYDFFHNIYGRNSIDDRGLRIDSTVHYGKHFANAMWNAKQMVYGDGDGKLFNRFTASIDVIGHELTHGVTQFSAELAYKDQSGALNEHLSDAFGMMVKHYFLGLTAAQSDWIIGEGLLTPRVQGKGIRSMSAPGTAYNDPVLGKDPQPAHMRDYKRTSLDNGGVHINSGIPNRAFYLAAIAIGGYTWEVLGWIWYLSVKKKLAPNANFADFADATTSVALEEFGTATAKAVAGAWNGVGVPITVKLPGRSRGVSHFQLIQSNDEHKGDIMPKSFQNEHAAATAMYGAVDSSMQQWVDFDEKVPPALQGKEQPVTAKPVTAKPVSALEHAVGVYKSVRPLLAGLTTLWVLPPAWRTGLALLVAAFDGLAAVPAVPAETVDVDFKAGKDL
jgi:hypothetical protein